MSQIDTILLGGGGLRGVYYIGMMKWFEEHNVRFKNLYGVSVGSIIALMIAIGYSSSELKDYVMDKDFKNLTDINLQNFLYKFGLDSGKNIMEWVQEALEKKTIDKSITFKQLHDITGVKLTVFTANLGTKQLTQLDYVTVPELKVIDAIRLSISIPFVFTAKKLNGSVHVDGAVIDNFPVQCVSENPERCLFVTFESLNEEDSHDVTSFVDFIKAVWSCMRVTASHPSVDVGEERVMRIPSFISDGLDFSMPTEKKEEMIRQGYDKTEQTFQQLIGLSSERGE